MPWPDIFYKGRNPRPQQPESSAPLAAKPGPIEAKADAVEPPKAIAPPTTKSVAQAMAEADTLRTLTRSGGVRLIKRNGTSTGPEISAPVPKIAALPAESPSVAPSMVETKSLKANKREVPPAVNSQPEINATPVPASAPAEHLDAASTTASEQRFKPARRKARLIDFARLILPPKRAETPPTVVPASFPVSVATGNVMQDGESIKKTTSPAIDISLSKRAIDVSADKIIEIIKSSDETSPADEPTAAPVTAPESTPLEPVKSAEPNSFEKTTPAEFKVDPPLPSSGVEPTTDNSVGKSLSTSPAPQEKREFHLANGERILGRVLSETPDAIYLEHATLGVLTLPRTQIAKRLVEVILINGDRIVGDIVAETPECLFVRHASLGMLTVPQTQRSTRVVEAILKDGDRILGEVLAETDTFTVIRSASLGTITVKHEQVALLNRKLEQVELKALPQAATALENKRV